VLLQDADDLLFREAAAPHVLVLSMGQNELQSGLAKRGNVSRTGSSALVLNVCSEIVMCRSPQASNIDRQLPG
jgi:hypothetical protein